MSRKRPFVSDVAELRRKARDHTDRGAVTAGYRADREAVVAMLNVALATELVCVLRYRRHHFMAVGLAAGAVAAEFLAHANEEQRHADQLAARIVQLNGAPDFDPSSLSARSHALYIEGDTLGEMILEDLVAERIAIDSYREMIAYIGADDSTTRRMLEEILAVEESHADEMADLLVVYTPAPRRLLAQVEDGSRDGVDGVDGVEGHYGVDGV
jgi:bacterioferritin